MSLSYLPNPDNVIRYIINTKYSRALLPHDELFQIGYIGYLKALKNYKEEYGDITIRYCEWYIRNELNTELKKAHKELHYNVDNVPEEGTDEHAEIDKISKEMEVVSIIQCLGILEPLERDIVTSLYLSNKHTTLAQLGRDHNLSRQRIHQIKETAIAKIREVL